MKEERILQQLDKMVASGRITEDEAADLRAAEGTERCLSTGFPHAGVFGIRRGRQRAFEDLRTAMFRACASGRHPFADAPAREASA